VGQGTGVHDGATHQQPEREEPALGGRASDCAVPRPRCPSASGENNAGESNITRALDILFGDMWPASRQMEEHDFHGRDSDGIAIEIGANVSGIPCSYCQHGQVAYFSWKYDAQNPADDGSPIAYSFTCSHCTRTFPKREMRTALASTSLDADRRLDYQLSYASKYTMLSKLMHRFHDRLLADGRRKDRLAAGFAELVAEFRGVPEFAQFQRVLSNTAEEFGQNLPFRLDVDFSAYDPSNFFRSLRVHPSFSGEVRSFDELGTGQGQVLALAFAYAYARAFGRSEGMILVIDEPEANLHPLAQQWLATRLNNLVSDGLQIVLTTHSPHFVDLARPENLVLVRKQDGEATKAVQRSRVELLSELVARGADATRTQPRRSALSMRRVQRLKSSAVSSPAGASWSRGPPRRWPFPGSSAPAASTFSSWELPSSRSRVLATSPSGTGYTPPWESSATASLTPTRIKPELMLAAFF
jgi:putative ATP-dependent endonuclease of the OLD family